MPLPGIGISSIIYILMAKFAQFIIFRNLTIDENTMNGKVLGTLHVV